MTDRHREEVAAADDRTLRLATPEVTAERLEKLIAFQRRFVDGASHISGDDAAQLSQLHDEAVAASGLTAREAGELEALARAYCGRRWTQRALEEHLDAAKKRIAEAKQAGREPAHKDLQVVEKVPEEIQERAELTRLERRYGEPVIALLRQRDATLLDLHEAIGRLLRK